MISNWIRAARLINFEITCMIWGQIALHSVQLPLSTSLEIQPISKSVWTERKYYSFSREQDVRLKLSICQKFIRCQWYLTLPGHKVKYKVEESWSSEDYPDSWENLSRRTKGLDLKRFCIQIKSFVGEHQKESLGSNVPGSSRLYKLLLYAFTLNSQNSRSFEIAWCQGMRMNISILRTRVPLLLNRNRSDDLYNAAPML